MDRITGFGPVDGGSIPSEPVYRNFPSEIITQVYKDLYSILSYTKYPTSVGSPDFG